MIPGENRRVFGRNASVLLDLLRFGAAVTVALTHLGGIFVNTGPIIPGRSGNTAVCVFFVLSGFVIRYVTVTRETRAAEYAIDRVSRIYSVVLPTLVLTVAFEAVSACYLRAGYLSVVSAPVWGALPMQLLQNLSFTVGWWGRGTTPLSNGPFWSLSFECVYYALYGLLRYAPRARWVLVPLLLVAVGPAIALLFPIWLVGAGLYDAYASLSRRRHSILLSSSVLLICLALLWVFRAAVGGVLTATTEPARAAALTHAVARLGWGRAWFHGETLPWLNRLSVSYFLTGPLLALAMLPALLVLDRYTRPVRKEVAARIRLVADSTFTLYLFHLPFLILLVSIRGGRFANWTQGWAALVATVAISIGLAMLFDRLKNAMRDAMRRGWTTRTTQRDAIEPIA